MKLLLPFHVSKVGAGFPSPATDYVKDDIDLNAHLIKNIPTIIIQGRYDLICPPKSAFLLAKNMSNCELKIIENSGHSMSEPNIKSNVLKAIDEIFYKIKKK